MGQGESRAVGLYSPTSGAIQHGVPTNVLCGFVPLPHDVAAQVVNTICESKF
jgi:hypothetical protein